MRKFKIHKSKEGAWFPYFGSKVTDKKDKDGKPVIEYFKPEPDAPRVKIRVADAQVLDEIRDKTTTRKTGYAHNETTGKMEMVNGFEPQTYQQFRESQLLLWDHVIEDLDGMVDESGALIQSTPENKMALMEDEEFSRFVTRCVQLSRETEEERKKAIEKN